MQRFCVLDAFQHVRAALSVRVAQKRDLVRIPVTVGTKVVPFVPFCFKVSILKLTVRKKGTLMIEG